LNALYNPQKNNYIYSSNETVKPKNQNIDELMQSKREVEEFIKQKYPDDYSRIKQHDKKSFIRWFTRVLGIN